jgi:hypothetical protein
LKREQLSYESCIERSYFISPTPAECVDILPDNFSVDDLNQILQQELLLSKNVFPGIRFSEVIPAEVPLKAARYQTNYLVLSGSIFGFLVSFLFLFKHNDGKK